MMATTTSTLAAAHIVVVASREGFTIGTNQLKFTICRDILIREVIAIVLT